MPKPDHDPKPPKPVKPPVKKPKPPKKPKPGDVTTADEGDDPPDVPPDQ